MFGRIDHIGVAVADLDAAIALHAETYGMAVAHRETVAEQGVEAVLLDVGENHVELLRPLSDDTPVGKFLARRGPGLHHVAYQVAGHRRHPGALRAAGVRLIDETPRTRDPRLARRVPASVGVGRCPHRDRATGYGAAHDGETSCGRLPWRAGPVPAHHRGRPRRSRDELRIGGDDRWYEVEAADGAVMVDLEQIVYLRVESDEHRVGF